MENAVKALEYAFAILIFIIGLSSSIYLLSEVKSTSDIVFSQIDTKQYYIDAEILGILKEYGVRTIELGLQSTSDEVLEISKRGHSSKDEDAWKTGGRRTSGMADAVYRNCCFRCNILGLAEIRE